ncbi:imelysin family protein [Flagellimonas onchidii]|uniref:imelysin family protein n=1 Tax=Flagellimonas onchidii TaxID=2562684 RepID=UPI0010A65126|nr:imelysin family protein [Allomuricauda onchidii]
MKKYWYLTIAIFLVIWACSSDGSGGDTGGTDDDGVPVTFDRGAMLVNWADNIIIPSYKAFQSELSNLNAAFETFSADKTVANLEALRTAWVNAYTAWQTVSMFEIGPAESVGYRLNVNTYPTDIEVIESNISSGTYDLSLPSNRDTKGFPALDYLLNGLEENDTDLVARWSSGTEAENTLDYIAALLTDMITLTDGVVSEWEGTYRNTFVENDGSSATASVDRYVNDYIFYFEKFLRAGKMGIPLGAFSGDQTPNTVEVLYKPELSKSMFLEGLTAVQDFFNGKHFDSTTTGESLASYLNALNTVKEGEDLSKRINDQMDSARDAVTGLGDFKTEIETNNPAVDMFRAYDEVQKVVPLLKVDMVSAMSISIDFVDADGD